MTEEARSDKMSLRELRKTNVPALLEQFEQEGGKRIEIDGRMFRITEETEKSHRKDLSHDLGDLIGDHIYRLMASHFEERSILLVDSINTTMVAALKDRTEEINRTIDAAKTDFASAVTDFEGRMIEVIQKVGAELDDERIEQLRDIEKRMRVDFADAQAKMFTMQIPTRKVPVLAITGIPADHGDDGFLDGPEDHVQDEAQPSSEPAIYMNFGDAKDEPEIEDALSVDLSDDYGRIASENEGSSVTPSEATSIDDIPNPFADEDVSGQEKSLTAGETETSSEFGFGGFDSAPETAATVTSAADDDQEFGFRLPSKKAPKEKKNPEENTEFSFKF